MQGGVDNGRLARRVSADSVAVAREEPYDGAAGEFDPNLGPVERDRAAGRARPGDRCPGSRSRGGGDTALMTPWSGTATTPTRRSRSSTRAPTSARPTCRSSGSGRRDQRQQGQEEVGRVARRHVVDQRGRLHDGGDRLRIAEHDRRRHGGVRGVESRAARARGRAFQGVKVALPTLPRKLLGHRSHQARGGGRTSGEGPRRGRQSQRGDAEDHRRLRHQDRARQDATAGGRNRRRPHLSAPAATP